MKIKLIAFLFLVFLISCSSSEAPKQSDVAYQKDVENGESKPTSEAPAPSSRGGGGGGREGGSDDKSGQVSLDQVDKSKTETVPTERKIIRNADLSLEVPSPEEAQQKITTIAETKGGFVIESQQRTNTSNVPNSNIVTMTLRIPAEKFNESLDEIRKVGSRVMVETIKGQDVTDEFVDIEARLKTQKALETQFLEIMKQGKTVQDALNVQRELANVRGEIEKIEGRKRFLENQTSLSTIKITLQSPASYSAKSSGFFYQLGQSINRGFDFALSFILGLVVFIIAILPFLLFIVLPIYLILRYLWRRFKARRTAREMVEQELKKEKEEKVE